MQRSKCVVAWREGSKVRNVHLGSCKKVDHETALQKARKMKRGALAIKPWTETPDSKTGS